MNWFGPEWGAPINQLTEPVEIPIGAPCHRCGRILVDGDRGVMLPNMKTDFSYSLVSIHLGCFLNEVLGTAFTGRKRVAMEILRYRKLPVEIEAVRLPEETENLKDNPLLDQIAEWCNGFVRWSRARPIGIGMETLEGTMTASLGDYVVRGVKGEFYPVKADIFTQTYELVGE